MPLVRAGDDALAGPEDRGLVLDLDLRLPFEDEEDLVPEIVRVAVPGGSRRMMRARISGAMKKLRTSVR